MAGLLEQIKDQDVVDGFQSCLQFLKKPNTWEMDALLEMAKKLAHPYAVEIAVGLVRHIREAPANQKAVAVYLLDVVVKKADPIYKSLFSLNVAGVFSIAFGNASAKEREVLFSVRKSWRDFFPNDAMSELDCAVQKHDPNWPMFLPAPKTKKTSPKSVVLTTSRPPIGTHSTTNSVVLAPATGPIADTSAETTIVKDFPPSIFDTPPRSSVDGSPEILTPESPIQGSLLSYEFFTKMVGVEVEPPQPVISALAEVSRMKRRFGTAYRLQQLHQMFWKYAKEESSDSATEPEEPAKKRKRSHCEKKTKPQERQRKVLGVI